MVLFGEFLKTWSLRSNSVTRQVSFNRTKIGGKCQNSKCCFADFMINFSSPKKFFECFDAFFRTYSQNIVSGIQLRLFPLRGLSGVAFCLKAKIPVISISAKSISLLPSSCLSIFRTQNSLNPWELSCGRSRGWGKFSSSSSKLS